MATIAIIGGTGVYDPRILDKVHSDEVITPYGSVSYKLGEYGGKIVAFIPRHGSGHSIPPHLINYRANIWAMKKIGVQSIFATTAVGSLNQNMKPGDFVLIDQFLDFTKTRTHTFYEGRERGVVHVDVTKPYCNQLRETMRKAAADCNIPVHTNGVYVCTEGPRFETTAEIAMFAKLGGDLVGMTNVPEVVLAREAEMCYATVSMVTNYAAGISKTLLTHEEVLATMKANSDKLKTFIMKTIDLLPADRQCTCHNALAEFGGFKL